MNRKARRATKAAGNGLHLSAVDASRANAALSATAQIERGHRNCQDGNLAEAMSCYLRAIELVPDYMDAHVNFCGVLIALSRFAEAAGHCEQLLAHDPRLFPAHIHLGVARIGMGDFRGAFAAAKSALRISQAPEARMLFAQCLQNLSSLPDHDADTREWLMRAIAEPWGRASEFARHGIAIVKADPVIGACIARAAAAWPRPLSAAELYGEDGLAAVARDGLLQAVLENTRLSDIATERFLTAARRLLLDAARVAQPVGGDALAFYCALARQCFINEYVYALGEDEATQAAALRDAIMADLASSAGISAIRIAAVAAYMPLQTITGFEHLLARSWPEPVNALLTQMIREPAEEARLRATIPALTCVDDGVSLLVQQQYEQNPYPRWIKTAPSSNGSEINAQLRRQFPRSPLRDIGKGGGIDLLVAGCGTGQQLIDIATRFNDTRVLAIDLSLASLAYARRKTEEFGLRNIEFGRADILKLKQIGRSFDVVDSAGVLHHLADPVAGWNVLISLLRPNGAMRIALYSEIARRHVVAGRKFVAGRGYDSSAEGIRRFRQDVLALPDDDPVRMLAMSGDFFSISDCRDLVFHVQEHRFTLPQIKALLAASGLNFLGFDIGPNLLTRYRAKFPDDLAATDLERWHAFEQANPWTFGGMYQFWVQQHR
jgi:SAM-dependent methyltransferase/tetratricopeptide (TPR) repeat protein